MFPAFRSLNAWSDPRLPKWDGKSVALANSAGGAREVENTNASHWLPLLRFSPSQIQPLLLLLSLPVSQVPSSPRAATILPSLHKAYSLLASLPVSQGPVVTVTNDYKFSSLNQHRYIPLLLWRSEVQDGSCWAKVKVLAGVVPSGGSRGESISLPFLTSRGHGYFLCCRLFLHFQSTFLRSLLPLLHTLLFHCEISLCLPLVSTLVITFRAHLDKSG